MVKLPADLEAKVRRHLGYSHPLSVADTYEYLFQQAISTIRSNADITDSPGGIRWWCQYLDLVLTATNPLSSKVFSARQAIIGDINRTTVTVELNNHKWWINFYYDECDRFAHTLSVPCLIRPEMRQRFLAAAGGTVVISPKGSPDTCVSDKIYLSQNYG